MSVLLGNEIIEETKKGNIFIDPFNEDNVGPNSMDVTLHDELLTYIPVSIVQQNGCNKVLLPYTEYSNTDFYIDMAEKNTVYSTKIPEEGLILSPGLLYLGSTNEKAGSDIYVPMYEGRSSLARLGFQSHLSAGFGDIGFKSNWTLEINVIHPTKIYPNKRVGQVYFHKVDEEYRKKLFQINKNYSGKYSEQSVAQESKSYLDF